MEFSIITIVMTSIFTLSTPSSGPHGQSGIHPTATHTRIFLPREIWAYGIAPEYYRRPCRPFSSGMYCLTPLFQRTMALMALRQHARLYHRDHGRIWGAGDGASERGFLCGAMYFRYMYTVYWGILRDTVKSAVLARSSWDTIRLLVGDHTQENKFRSASRGGVGLRDGLIHINMLQLEV